MLSGNISNTSRITEMTQKWEQNSAVKKGSAGHSSPGTEKENVDFQKLISERKNEIYEKLKNGETEQSFQIGGESFTKKEWDKLLFEVDDMIDDAREAMREKHRKRYEEMLKKEETTADSIEKKPEDII